MENDKSVWMSLCVGVIVGVNVSVFFTSSSVTVWIAGVTTGILVVIIALIQELGRSLPPS
jgi:hypothetical protein